MLDAEPENQPAGSQVQHVIAVLDCFDGSHENGLAMGIILTGHKGTSVFRRLFYECLVEVDTGSTSVGSKTIMVSPESKWFASRGPRQLSESK